MPEYQTELYYDQYVANADGIHSPVSKFDTWFIRNIIDNTRWLIKPVISRINNHRLQSIFRCWKKYGVALASSNNVLLWINKILTYHDKHWNPSNYWSGQIRQYDQNILINFTRIIYSMKQNLDVTVPL